MLKRKISKVVNWCTGGSYNQYYCDRLEEEGSVRKLYLLNWLIFLVLGDADHYNRVKERTRKDV